jgi:heterodisulfide reductase subunit C
MSHQQATSSDWINRQAHTRLQDCYQCGKCSAGCPVNDRMDLLPNQLLRLVQLGRNEKAAASEAIWQCLSCQTCTARCPKSVDCASVLDALRQLAIEQSCAASTQRRTQLFQQAFLSSIRRHGRLHELELIGAFKAAAFAHDWNPGAALKDSLLAPKLARRGKLHLRGESVKDRGVVRRIFQRCLAESNDAAPESRSG